MTYAGHSCARRSSCRSRAWANRCGRRIRSHAPQKEKRRMVLHVSVRPRTCLSRGDGSLRMVVVGRERTPGIGEGWMGGQSCVKERLPGNSAQLATRGATTRPSENPSLVCRLFRDRAGLVRIAGTCVVIPGIPPQTLAPRRDGRPLLRDRASGRGSDEGGRRTARATRTSSHDRDPRSCSTTQRSSRHKEGA
jgi:hypothetical protein